MAGFIFGSIFLGSKATERHPHRGRLFRHPTGPRSADGVASAGSSRMTALLTTEQHPASARGEAGSRAFSSTRWTPRPGHTRDPGPGDRRPATSTATSGSLRQQHRAAARPSPTLRDRVAARASVKNTLAGALQQRALARAAHPSRDRRCRRRYHAAASADRGSAASSHTKTTSPPRSASPCSSSSCTWSSCSTA